MPDDHHQDELRQREDRRSAICEEHRNERDHGERNVRQPVLELDERPEAKQRGPIEVRRREEKQLLRRLARASREQFEADQQHRKYEEPSSMVMMDDVVREDTVNERLPRATRCETAT